MSDGAEKLHYILELPAGSRAFLHDVEEGLPPCCEVPAAAAIYADDMYVERSFSEETAALVPSVRAWLTNEYEHNGLRTGGARVLDRLIGLARGR